MADSTDDSFLFGCVVLFVLHFYGSFLSHTNKLSLPANNNYTHHCDRQLQSLSSDEDDNGMIIVCWP